MITVRSCRKICIRFLLRVTWEFEQRSVASLISHALPQFLMP